ncbi:MAG: hypothetical protein EXR77_10745 [Myxococcales bacterium]|nr:hypothetical protein [Myxococcales bacterium]
MHKALVALAAYWLAGCAVNLSEARPARVLRGGEVQVSEINNIIVPTGALADGAKSVELVYTALREKKSLSAVEQRDFAGRTAANALTGPGFGAHVDISLGLGYRLDTSFRFGNGIYAASVRRGFDGPKWHGNVGVRAGYNTGMSVIPYLEQLNSYVEIADTSRWDWQAFAQLGREFQQWGRIWFGAKAMRSVFTVTVDATKLGLSKEVIDDQLDYLGGSFGFALGYRYAFFVGELHVLRSIGSVYAFGGERGLNGITIAPSWGILGQF